MKNILSFDDPVLKKGKWIDLFYQMHVWVSINGEKPLFYLDRNDILAIVPEIATKNGVDYSRVSLINLLMIKNILDRQKKLETISTILLVFCILFLLDKLYPWRI